MLDAEGVVEVDAANDVEKERERLKKVAESATKLPLAVVGAATWVMHLGARAPHTELHPPIGLRRASANQPTSGLPAFNPGEKVQIDFGDDDL